MPPSRYNDLALLLLQLFPLHAANRRGLDSKRTGLPECKVLPPSTHAPLLGLQYRNSSISYWSHHLDAIIRNLGQTIVDYTLDLPFPNGLVPKF